MAKYYKKENFIYTGNVQVLDIPNYIDEFFIEAYGSCGTPSSYKYHGLGGYIKGKYKITDNIRRFYVYVGGNVAFADGFSFNGGGSGAYYGGGATDIRTVKATDGSWYDTSHDSWDSDKSLLSRIAVAAGGGGTARPYCNSRGHGGGLSGNKTDGNSQNYRTAYGGSQTSGGSGQKSGGFGYGGPNGSGGGGGSGWYGGGSGGPQYSYAHGGAGGSSYIDKLSDNETTSGINNSTGKCLISYQAPGFIFKSKNTYYYNNDGEYIPKEDLALDFPDLLEYGCDINNPDCIPNIRQLNKFKIIKLKE